MKEELILTGRINMIEKELQSLTDKIEKMCNGMREIEDLKMEIKGLKIYPGRKAFSGF